ncbi:hypothetical protein GCM10022380_65270 [Amycolatopsis tucumanensis]|uniref:DUF1963 domain-containing protein n=1 Tax=Amycolatopsis tucumanensis TaxID=401106 RepID=A0ABP7J8X5_9PSEU
MPDFAELRETHRRKVRAAGLGEFADELVAASLPSVRLLPARGPHRTRLGGDPELPPATPWPRAGHTPLSFVAQLDLSEMAPYDAEGILPADGLLSFFYDAIHQPWGFDPAHRDSATVLFTPGDAEVATRQAPSDLPANGRFSPVPLRPHDQAHVHRREAGHPPLVLLGQARGPARAGVGPELARAAVRVGRAQPRVSSMTVTSGRAPMRIGGPQ